VSCGSRARSCGRCFGLARLEFPRFRGHFLREKESVDMPRTRPAYPPEFRAQIVALARAGRSVEDLAREFEPPARTRSAAGSTSRSCRRSSRSVRGSRSRRHRRAAAASASPRMAARSAREIGGCMARRLGHRCRCAEDHPAFGGSRVGLAWELRGNVSPRVSLDPASCKTNFA